MEVQPATSERSEREEEEEAEDSEEGQAERGALTDDGLHSANAREAAEPRGYNSETSTFELPKRSLALCSMRGEPSRPSGGACGFGLRRNRVGSSGSLRGGQQIGSFLHSPLLPIEGESSEFHTEVMAARRRSLLEKRLPPTRRQLKGSAQAGVQSCMAPLRLPPRAISEVPEAAACVPTSGFALPPLISGSSSEQDVSQRKRCTSYCLGLSLELEDMFRPLQGHGHCSMHRDGLNAVLHCSINALDAHAFYFSYGSIVTWGLSERAELNLISELKMTNHVVNPLSDMEVDDFWYVTTVGAKPTLQKDTIQLSTEEIKEKLAVSFALAQSVKLGVFERTVDQTIHDTRHIPEQMARDGTIKLKRKQITKQIGQLFVDRASINLHSDILDHPDFFWEDDEWLSFYLRVSKYLETDRRVEVLNKRLDIIKELFDMLASEVHNSHANKLEWIIIILIVLEVFFQIVELLMPWFGLTA